jgi:hypothetical protein
VVWKQLSIPPAPILPCPRSLTFDSLQQACPSIRSISSLFLSFADGENPGVNEHDMSSSCSSSSPPNSPDAWDSAEGRASQVEDTALSLCYDIFQTALQGVQSSVSTFRGLCRELRRDGGTVYRNSSERGFVCEQRPPLNGRVLHSRAWWVHE